MDFTQYDSRAAAENGAWLHMRNPATGELLYDDGKPCMVKVQGSESRKVIKAMGAAIALRWFISPGIARITLAARRVLS